MPFALANAGLVAVVLMFRWSVAGSSRKAWRALAVASILYLAWLPLITHVASN